MQPFPFVLIAKGKIANELKSKPMNWAIWNLPMRLRDHRVLRFMDEQRLELHLQQERNLEPEPISVALIAQRCNRSVRSTTKSLLRLEERGRVYEVKPGAWLPGERPQSAKPYPF